MELILYKDAKEFYLTKLLEKICSKYTGLNVKLPLPQEINDMIYSYTDFITCLNNNCSDYILDKFYNNNRCVRSNVNDYSLNYSCNNVFCRSNGNCCFYKDFCDDFCDTTKYKIFKYSIKKNKLTICDFDSLKYHTNLYEFILLNRVFIKAFSVTDYNKIKQIFEETKLNNKYTFSTNYNVMRIMCGMAGLSYSS
jgi:hypothetical protein